MYVYIVAGIFLPYMIICIIPVYSFMGAFREEKIIENLIL